MLFVIEAQIAGRQAMLRHVQALQSGEHAAARLRDGDLLVVDGDRGQPLGDGDEPPRNLGTIDEDLVHQRPGFSLLMRSGDEARNRVVHIPAPSLRVATGSHQLSAGTDQPYFGLVGTEAAVSQPVDLPLRVFRQSFGDVAGPAHDREFTASLLEGSPPLLGPFARYTSSRGCLIP